MKLNKFFISLAIVLVCGVIIGMTAYKVITEHNKKVLIVETKYIISQAKKCYYDDICTNDKITLQELYDKNYLERQVNSVTKEYYDSESYVMKNGNDFEFYTP